MEAITFKPIGIVRSPFKKPEGMPIQPTGGRGIHGYIDLDPEYQQGLMDLEDFSHIILVYHFHQSSGYTPTVKPFLDDQTRGLFATRAPNRPNPIGLSVVSLVEIKGNRLTISDIDILDGTPLLDIKPFIPDFDSADDVRLGWLEGKSNQASSHIADNRFC